MANLAILGGKALFPGDPVLPWTGWPPRDEETAEALKKVYMSGEWSFNSPSEQAFEQAFADAWEKLLSANYRCSNLNHTGYMGGLLGQYGDYELEPYLIWERLGTERILVEQTIFTYNKKGDKYLWYEYIPACLKTAEPKSPCFRSM